MTKPLPLRSEAPPDDVAVVIRAGIMGAGSVRNAAERTFSLFAVFGISVEAAIDASVQDVCRTSRVVSYRQVRLSTFGDLRRAGFAVLATFDRPHFTVVLPDLSELTIARLGRAFGPPIPNPGRPAGQ